ncbi:MAG: hypothetical protein NTW84_07285 [Methanothrix sp.]|nr:hypothetical protein [Methanothrix sp.]
MKGVKDLSYAHFIASSPELKDELSSSLLKKGSVILVPGFSATMQAHQGNKKFFYFQDILIEIAYLGGERFEDSNDFGRGSVAFCINCLGDEYRGVS